MRLKLLNLLSVSLVTVVILYPALLVLSVVWQEHLQMVLDKQNNMFKMIHWLLFLIPICLELVILGYDRYRNHHTITVQQQVKMLEKLWHQS
ncbi:MAG: hypothetical protein QNJ63_22475 [Calothrix sp. MO_192.B10]|nr:hypothetical protein [Calothrix sp. MO_192.B10]